MKAESRPRDEEILRLKDMIFYWHGVARELLQELLDTVESEWPPETLQTVTEAMRKRYPELFEDAPPDIEAELRKPT